MHIFITGGTRGIGHGVVKEFLQNGHQVSYTGTSEDSIKKSQVDLKGDFLALVCDVRYKDMLEIAMKLALDKFGDIDIWINNAGVDQDRLDVSDLSEAEIKRVVDINISGTMLGTSLALDLMKKQGTGIVYNLEGLGSNNMTIPKTSIYGTTKRAITYFTKACKKEIRDYPNVFVGTIQPGMVFTDLLLKNLGDDGMKIANIIGNDVDYVAHRIVRGVLKRDLKISIMSNINIMWRFMKSPFKKKKKIK